MPGFGRHSEQEWRCPFCKKGLVKVYFREGFLQAKGSSISAGKKYIKYKVDDKIEEIGNDCSVCGKKANEIKKAFDTGITTEKSHEERLKRLRESGIPTKIVSSKNKE